MLNHEKKKEKDEKGQKKKNRYHAWKQGDRVQTQLLPPKLNFTGAL